MLDESKEPKQERIKILEKKEQYEALKNPTKKNILKKISKKSKTITELARELKIPKSEIAYHVKGLRNSGLIRLERTEEDKKGLRKKYYLSTAQVFLTNDDAPQIVKDDLIAQAELFVIGYLEGLRHVNKFEEDIYEKIKTEDLAASVVRESLLLSKEPLEAKPTVLASLFRKALQKIISRDEKISYLLDL